MTCGIGQRNVREVHLRNACLKQCLVVRRRDGGWVGVLEILGGWVSKTPPTLHSGGGVWTAKTVKRPRQQPAHPQYANYWAPLTRKRHIPPHPAQPQHTNDRAPRTRKRHQREHRPQRPTERSAPTQHAKGRTGDCPGPCKETATRRNATRGVPFDPLSAEGKGKQVPRDAEEGTSKTRQRSEASSNE